MSTLTTIIKKLDAFTEALGKISAYFSALMVLVTCYIVINRYVFNNGSVAVQESVIYMNAILVFISAAFTLKHNGHVRVDIIYGAASERYKAWVNMLGAGLLLVPTLVFVLLISWDYVSASWQIREGSADPGGLPYVYLLKSIIPIFCILLLLQGLAEFLRNLAELINPSRVTMIIDDEQESGTL